MQTETQERQENIFRKICHVITFGYACGDNATNATNATGNATDSAEKLIPAGNGELNL
jgi:hypothetical protein